VVDLSRYFQDWDDDDPKARFHQNRWEFWTSITRASELYRADTMGYDNIWDWFEDQYGLRVTLNRTGEITDEFVVKDEQKYLMFLLKFR
jgi:hypothetical protein